MEMIKAIILVAACVNFSTEVAFADGDVAQGEKVFQRCSPCHSVSENVNKVGPSLKGIVGRPVASVNGFSYSNAMKAFAATGAIWDGPTLDTYLKGPSDLVKGTKMSVPPVRRDTERADLIAYLKSKM
jgi:cytochrome c